VRPAERAVQVVEGPTYCTKSIHIRRADAADAVRAVEALSAADQPGEGGVVPCGEIRSRSGELDEAGQVGVEELCRSGDAVLWAGGVAQTDIGRDAGRGTEAEFVRGDRATETGAEGIADGVACRVVAWSDSVEPAADVGVVVAAACGAGCLGLVDGAGEPLASDGAAAIEETCIGHQRREAFVPRHEKYSPSSVRAATADLSMPAAVAPESHSRKKPRHSSSSPQCCRGEREFHETSTAEIPRATPATFGAGPSSSQLGHDDADQEGVLCSEAIATGG
jgi:hypothetical protein